MNYFCSDAFSRSRNHISKYNHVMYSIKEIVKRYNDSVSDYAAYRVAVNEHQIDKQEKYLRNAGEGLSQVIEQAIKLHIQFRDPSRLKYLHSGLPQMIEDLYLDSSGYKQDMFDETLNEDISPTVDFDFIRTHKQELTNSSKHGGGRVNSDIVAGYITQCNRFIKEYLDDKALLRDVDYFMAAPQDGIQQFYVACEHFQRDDRTFILLTEKDITVDRRYYQFFSKAPWDIIIDFDKDSMDSGFGSVAYNGGADIGHIFKAGDPVTSEDFTMSIRKPVYFFANGYKGDRPARDFNEWNRVYYRKTDNFLQAVSQSMTSQKTVVISLLKDEEYIDSIRMMISRHFSSVKCIIANDPSDALIPLVKRRGNYYEHISSSIEDINRSMVEYLSIGGGTEDEIDETYSVPFLSDEGNGLLTKAELQDLEECFEVLYLGVGDGSDEINEPFLRGETSLSWQGAKRGFAAKRERFQKLYVKPLEAEIKKGRNKVIIVHEPGFGGSTVARQLAYDLHESYPVLYLKEYHNKAVIHKLDWLHDRTKKTIVVFMEIPSVISAEDFDYLYGNSNQSRPYVFVGIKRGKENAQNLCVTEWGRDTILLADIFRPVIEMRYHDKRKEEKLKAIESILLGNCEPYNRTPFYFGLLTYETDFVAANGYFEKFAKAVECNEAQKKSLVYLMLSDFYAGKSLPEAFFKTVFGVDEKSLFKISNYFSETDGIVNSLMQKERVGNMTQIKPKYSFFSKLFLQKLLRKDNAPEDTGWIDNLGVYCKEFIKDVAANPLAIQLQESILQPLFIGSSREREGEKFTGLVETIREEERINIFLTLHEQFPDNPHFCSHLARYYAMKEKNMALALDYADLAIRLSDVPDPLLHHIKGMCLYYILCDRIDNVKRQMKLGEEPTQKDLSDITDTLLTQAEWEFQKSREIQQGLHHDDEYGYIPNIKILLRVFDFYVLATGAKKKDVISSAREPFISWLDKAQSLLESARRLHEEGEESSHFISCETELWAEYDDYSSLIEKLNNQLVNTSQPAVVRRQLAQIYMRRDNDFKTSKKANERILKLMDDNMKSDNKNVINFLLWFKAARYSDLSIRVIIQTYTVESRQSHYGFGVL